MRKVDRLSVKDLRVLVLAHKRKRVTLTLVAGELRMSTATAHQTLMKLGTYGYLKKEGNIYEITEDGERALDEVRKILWG